MKFLTLSADRSRLTLLLPDSLPLRSAANAVRGCRREGVSDGTACFSYPAKPDVAALLLETFAPQIGQESHRAIQDLLDRQASLERAAAAKDAPVAVDPADWGLRTVPMQHQAQALTFCWTRFEVGAPGSALLMEQGTGKSLVAIGLANRLYRDGKIAWAMVIGPNSLKGTWSAQDGQILEHSAETPRLATLRGSRDQKQAQLLRELSKPAGALRWIVTNYDEFAIKLLGPAASKNQRRFSATQQILAGAGPGLLICDESAELKNSQALRTLALLKLRDSFPYRMILTGTPVEAGPLDVYPQFEMLEPGCLGYRSPLEFEKAHAVYVQKVVPIRGGGKRAIRVVDSYRNLDELERRIAKVSFRARASECLDLPPVTAVRIPVELDANQQRILRELKGEKMATVPGGFLDGRNVLTRYQKMAQTMGGWAKAMDRDGKPTGWVETGQAKLKALEEYLDLAMQDPQRKVVVFATHPETEIRAIAELAERKGWGAVTFHGGVSAEERDARRQDFVHGRPRVFVAQWETAARGLNLTAADTVVFYSLTWRYGTWSQARKRVHRQGQDRHVTEVYFLSVATQRRTGKPLKTLDHVIAEALLNKQDVADVITGDRVARLMEAL